VNGSRFLSLDDANQWIEAWGEDSNRNCPNGALSLLPPREFARQDRKLRAADAAKSSRKTLCEMGQAQGKVRN